MPGAPNKRRKLTREERAKRNEKKERRRKIAQDLGNQIKEAQRLLEEQKRAADAGIVLAQPGDLLGIPKDVRERYGS